MRSRQAETETEHIHRSSARHREGPQGGSRWPIPRPIEIAVKSVKERLYGSSPQQQVVGIGPAPVDFSTRPDGEKM